ncbi:hypothetical protein KR059_004030 [Drosophila kikkawai]|nr:uncharacterized protein LOC108075486 [Drosophila kikkawai]KAH8340679.1 hypothetical protein KR059_004030 [Drosophila kikkawai]
MGKQHIWSVFLGLLLLEQLVAGTKAANLAQLVKKQSQQKQGQPVLQLHPQQQQQQQQQQAGQQIHAQQYVQDSMAEQQDLKAEEEEDHDPYQLLQDAKQESRLPSSANYPWSSYAASQGIPPNPYEAMPKMLPFIGYAQPVLIPFPLYLAPDMFYPAFSGASNDLEDVVMSRAAGGRRPAASHSSPARNSPIYYVRLPPTPYMFVPNMPTAPFGGGFSPLLTYQPMPSFSAYGSVFNLPVNFLANGKPTGIYQVDGSPSEGLGSLGSSGSLGSGTFGLRPPTPSNPFRPMSSPSVGGYGNSPQSFGLASMPVPQQDSKLTSLKRPFVFNGRPEDIYILPNNLSPWNNEPSYY